MIRIVFFDIQNSSNLFRIDLTYESVVGKCVSYLEVFSLTELKYSCSDESSLSMILLTKLLWVSVFCKNKKNFFFDNLSIMSQCLLVKSMTCSLYTLYSSNPFSDNTASVLISQTV